MQHALLGYMEMTHQSEAGTTTRRATSVLYWSVQLLVWGAYFWWQASGEVTFGSVPWSKAVAPWGTFCIVGVGLTEGLRRWSRRNRWLELPASTLIARLALGWILVTTIAYTIMVAASIGADGTPVAPMLRAFYRGLPLWNKLVNQYILTLTDYLMWIAAYFGVATIRQRYQTELRHAQLAEALKAAELRLLESQLNPHFLFNALNGVRALIAEEPARAQLCPSRTSVASWRVSGI